MGDAQRGDDAIYFYAANLGRTTALAVSVVSAQTPDSEGALPPGRYLLHLGDDVASTTIVWVTAGPFTKGGTLTAVAAVPLFPMSTARIVTIEINVRKGDNDRIAAIASAGAGTLFVTQVSRGA